MCLEGKSLVSFGIWIKCALNLKKETRYQQILFRSSNNNDNNDDDDDDDNNNNNNNSLSYK